MMKSMITSISKSKCISNMRLGKYLLIYRLDQYQISYMKQMQKLNLSIQTRQQMLIKNTQCQSLLKLEYLQLRRILSAEQLQKIMGCAIFPDEKHQPTGVQGQRGSKKTEKIDCRKRSTQALDIVVQNVTVQEETIDRQNIEFACEVLKQHSLFCTLDSAELENVASMMQIATAKNNQYIFTEGDTGACFFIIKQGSVAVQIQQKTKRTLGKADCFGQLALLYCTKRTASVKCASDNLKLLLLKSKMFKQVMKGIRDKNNAKTKTLLQNVQIFSLLTTKQKYTMLNCLVRQHFKKGSVLFLKDDIPTCFYIIQSGKVSLQFDDPTKKDIVLGELQSFGESTFKKNGRREGKATVVQDLVCLTINQDRMKECLGGTLSSIVYHNIKKWALKSSPLFHQLENKDLDHVAMQFVTKHAKAGGIIADSEKPINDLVICIEGKINSKPVGTLFNDEYINIKDAKMETDLVKNDNGVYASLSFQKLKQILQALNNKNSPIAVRKRESLRLKQNENALQLDNLEYLTKLGEGQFGLVHLVKDKKSGNLFALKCLNKQKIKQQAIEESAVSERQILSTICHPLIVGYYKAYQDRTNIYFLLEYIYGIEMFDAIREINILNKSITRFYFGSLVLAVEYLHSKNIIYRDLKPENSIVNYQGKVYLIDMGTAKILKSDNGYRTDTIIGTPHYMAPQVMQGKGYTFQADYWSFGSLLYELIFGNLPFIDDKLPDDEEIQPYKIYSYIMQNQLVFPSSFKDDTAKSLMKKLLCKNPQSRLIGGFAEIKNSPYFQGFNWEELYNGRMVPPYVPRKFRSGSMSKYTQMQGYPLRQFLYDKRKGERFGTQQFEPWINNVVI